MIIHFDVGREKSIAALEEAMKEKFGIVEEWKGGGK